MAGFSDYPRKKIYYFRLATLIDSFKLRTVSVGRGPKAGYSDYPRKNI